MFPPRSVRILLPLTIILVIVTLAFLPSTQRVFNQQSQDFEIWDRLSESLECLGGRNQELLSTTPQIEYEGSIKDCSVCTVSPELCENVGEKMVLKSQSFLGTGDRMKRFLAKARSGQGFTVGVVGGSVSAGHGLYDQPNNNSTKLSHRIIFDHLDALFPAEGGTSYGEYVKGKNNFINGALPATGSGYFSYCFSNHIPEETDLVLVELGINDELKMSSFETYETLLRGLLDLPNQPAIISLQVFALRFAHLAMGGDLHMGISQFYDIPTISLRNAIMGDILSNQSLIEEYFAWTSTGPDDRHIGPKGHMLLGNLTNAYINQQNCQIDQKGASDRSPDEWPVDPIPRMLLNEKYQKDLITPRFQPNCLSANVQGKNHLTPSSQEGWREWSWKEKNYWISDTPGSTITFEFSTALGKLELYYLRAKEFKLGNAFCWVDDDKKSGKELVSYWTKSYNIGEHVTLGENLEPGKHTISCELLEKTDDPQGGNEFRIISLMSL